MLLLRPRRKEAHRHRGFQSLIDPGGRGGGGVCCGLQVLTALQLAPPLAIGGGRHADVHHVVSRGLVVGRALGDLFLRDDAVDFCCLKKVRLDRS